MESNRNSLSHQQMPPNHPYTQCEDNGCPGQVHKFDQDMKASNHFNQG